MKRFLLLACLLPALARLAAQPLPDEVYRSYAQASFPMLRELLAIPNDAHFPDEIDRNVQWCEGAFTHRGFRTQRLTTPGAPLLLAEYRAAEAEAKTVLVYLQVDGQPVDSSLWFQDNPYQATLKERAADGGWEALEWSRLEEKDFDPEWRIFARSTADSKGAVSMFLTAMDLLNDRGQVPNFHLKVIMDFEEEMGSPNLPQAVTDYQEALAADMLIIFDGPRHLTNQPTLTFGARGISDVTLKVFGPVFPQQCVFPDRRP